MSFLIRVGAITLTFLSLAAAQISFPRENFSQTLKVQNLADSFAYGKGTVQVDALAGLLYKVTYRGPATDYLSAGQVLAAAMGQPGVSAGFVNYMRQNAAGLKDKGLTKLDIGDGYDFRLELSNELSFSIGPEEVPEFGRDRNILGSKGVMIREFSDFECPYCKKFALESWPEIKRRFVDTGQARFSYRHLPLFEIHPQAYPAALASECAAQQNKFFPFHDALFIKGLDYIARAKEAKLDMNRFQTCMAGAQTVQIVFGDFNIARKLGINGTPTIFVGQFRLPDPYTVTVYERYLKMAAALESR